MFTNKVENIVFVKEYKIIELNYSAKSFLDNFDSRVKTTVLTTWFTYEKFTRIT